MLWCGEKGGIGWGVEKKHRVCVRKWESEGGSFRERKGDREEGGRKKGEKEREGREKVRENKREREKVLNRKQIEGKRVRYKFILNYNQFISNNYSDLVLLDLRCPIDLKFDLSVT